MCRQWGRGGGEQVHKIPRLKMVQCNTLTRVGKYNNGKVLMELMFKNINSYKKKKPKKKQSFFSKAEMHGGENPRLDPPSGPQHIISRK